MRPVVVSVVKDFIEFTNAPSTTKIRYKGVANGIFQSGSDISSKFGLSADETEARTQGTDRIWIEIEENFLDENELTRPILRPDVKVYFKDSDLGVYIRPAYKACEIRITLNARTKDRASLERWRTSVQTLFTRQATVRHHELTFHSAIPKEMMMVLMEIHRLREANHGLNEVFGLWLKRCFDERFTFISNTAGRQLTPVVTETQLKSLGYFGMPYNSSPGNKQSENGSWTYSFDYVIRFDVPTELIMRYPILVHNQPIKYRSKEKAPDYLNKRHEGSFSTEMFEIMADPIKRQILGYTGISIPHYDDWIPNYIPYNDVQVFRMAIVVDELNPRNVLDIRQLGAYNISPDAIAFLQATHESACGLGGNPIRFTLYAGYKPIEQGVLSLNSDLILQTDFDLDPTVNYHVVMQLNGDPITFEAFVKEMLRNHADFCIAFFRALVPGIADEMLPVKLPNGKISFKSLNDAMFYVTSLLMNRQVRYRLPPTVGIFDIEGNSR